MTCVSRPRLALAALSLTLFILPARVLAQHSQTSRSGAMTVGVRILNPAPGAVVRGQVLHVRVALTHWKLSCAWAGKANKPGIGHYHILLDGALINMFCSNTAAVSMQNVKPGKHTLTVLPAENDHSTMMFMQNKEMAEAPFTYRPSHPLPGITGVNPGKPGITITSPRNGATVGRTFALAIAVHNFHLSCALYGKPNITGWGHWHINHDSMIGPMMGMGTMLGMSCAKSFQVSTAGLKHGKHTFFAILEDNQHAPLMPSVFDKVTVNVK